MQRRRIKHTISLEDRLRQQAEELRKRAESLLPGSEREKLLWDAKKTDTAAHIKVQLSSPGLQSPK
jgi:hypothetical protein